MNVREMLEMNQLEQLNQSNQSKNSAMESFIYVICIYKC